MLRLLHSHLDLAKESLTKQESGGQSRWKKKKIIQFNPRGLAQAWVNKAEHLDAVGLLNVVREINHNIGITAARDRSRNVNEDRFIM